MIKETRVNTIDGQIRATIDRLALTGQQINGTIIAEQVGRDLDIEVTALLREQSNRACRQWYLRDVSMPYALQSLRSVGCLHPDAFTLALAGWEGTDMPVAGPDGVPPSRETQTLFREAYAIACGVLGLEHTEPDLRPVPERTGAQIEQVMTSLRWAGLAKLAEVDALKAELERRKLAKQ